MKGQGLREFGVQKSISLVWHGGFCSGEFGSVLE